MKVTNDHALSNNYKIENKKVIKDESKFDNESSVNKIVSKVNELIAIAKDNIRPVLTEPEIKSPDIKKITKALEVNNDNDIYDDVKNSGVGSFNFLSDDMMKLINLMVKYLEAMIKKFEASREMGVMLMNIELNIADQIKENLDKKANIMIGAAITSAGVSMAIHGMGAFTSVKGMGKDLIGHSNPTMIGGHLITSTADPLARVADQTIQSRGIILDGEQKVLEARGSINNHVINNNNEIQREITEVIKALLQAIEAVIHAQQEAASAIGANVKG
ncbi:MULTISPECIES: type III secretion protein [Enterobacterales]|uniref:type III secretion protein n=1 Tax=Enterobacterales TaxID=91347 RepID=UPI00084820D3|nr:MULTISPECIES: type III secretion protein [Enterobacterales]ODQ08100.1 type III secretion protein [Shigella sp. FC130]OEI93195.1 type III secretion protein [Shigella sp. FC1655]WOO49377.1 type III secretion protein [Hafnia alvei]WPF03843.1 type III secretion protein [Proteus vulgaris]